MLKFQQKGLKEVHLLTEQINFPVAIAVYNDWEKTQVQYLLANIKSTRFTSYSICRWCIVHKIQYQILYPIRKISILFFKTNHFPEVEQAIVKTEWSCKYTFIVFSLSLTAISETGKLEDSFIRSNSLSLNSFNSIIF